MPRLGLATRRHQEEETVIEEERKIFENAGIDYDTVKEWTAEERKSTLQALQESADLSKQGDQPSTSRQSDDEVEKAEDSDGEDEENDLNLSTQAPEDLGSPEGDDFEVQETLAPASPPQEQMICDESQSESDEQEHVQKATSSGENASDVSEGETQAYDVQTSYSKSRPSQLMDGEAVRNMLEQDKDDPVPSKPHVDIDADDHSSSDDSGPVPAAQRAIRKSYIPENVQIHSNVVAGGEKTLPRNNRSLGFLYPTLYAPECLPNPDVYIPVIRLMFNIYLRRLLRSRKNVQSKKEKWGDPVTAGCHYEGCMKMKPESKTARLPETRPVHHGRSLRSRTGLLNSNDNHTWFDDDSREEVKFSTGGRSNSRNVRSDKVFDDDSSGEEFQSVSTEKKVGGKRQQVTRNETSNSNKQVPSFSKEVFDNYEETPFRMDVNTDEDSEKEDEKRKRKKYIAVKETRSKETFLSASVESSDDGELLIEEDEDWVPERKKPCIGKGKASRGRKTSTRGKIGRGRKKQLELSPKNTIESVFKKVAQKRSINSKAPRETPVNPLQKTSQKPDGSSGKEKIFLFESDSDEDYFRFQQKRKSNIEKIFEDDHNRSGIFEKQTKNLQKDKSDKKETKSSDGESSLESLTIPLQDGHLEQKDVSNNNNITGRRLLESTKCDRPPAGLSQDNDSRDSVISLLNMDGDMYCTQVGQRKKKKAQNFADVPIKTKTSVDDDDKITQVETSECRSKRPPRKAKSASTVEVNDSKSTTSDWSEKAGKNVHTSSRKLHKTSGGSISAVSKHQAEHPLSDIVEEQEPGSPLTLRKGRSEPEATFGPKSSPPEPKEELKRAHSSRVVGSRSSKQSSPTGNINKALSLKDVSESTDDIERKSLKAKNVNKNLSKRKKPKDEIVLIESGEADLSETADDMPTNEDASLVTKSVLKGRKRRRESADKAEQQIKRGKNLTTTDPQESAADKTVRTVPEVPPSPPLEKSPTAAQVPQNEDSPPRLVESDSDKDNEPSHPDTGQMGYCPLCGKMFLQTELEVHAATCGEEPADNEPEPRPENEECLFCEKMIPVAMLKQHQGMCSKLSEEEDIPSTSRHRPTRSTRGQGPSKQ